MVLFHSDVRVLTWAPLSVLRKLLKYMQVAFVTKSGNSLDERRIDPSQMSKHTLMNALGFAKTRLWGWGTAPCWILAWRRYWVPSPVLLN